VKRRRDRRFPYRILGAGVKKRPLARPGRRGKDDCKIDIQWVGWGVIYWIYLVKDRDGWRALINTEKKTSGIQNLPGNS